MSDRPSKIVDFIESGEAGYQQIFARSPLLSSISSKLDDLLFAYDYFPPGVTPSILSKQHSLGIFIDLPAPVSTERSIDGKLRREVVMRGDTVIVPADTWHHAEWNRGGGAIVVSLEPQAMLDTLNRTLDRERLELIPYFATTDPTIDSPRGTLRERIGISLKHALEHPGNLSRLYAESMLDALAMHLLQHYSVQKYAVPTYQGGLAPAQLEQIVDYIDVYLDRDLSLHELAQLAQLSPHYFSQLFKQSTGFAPRQYILRHRIDRGKKLLRQGGTSIARVAQMVGFVDQSHFHRHFKRLEGVTPKAFVDRVR
jgi:AraC family transcriptional regulator